MRDDAPASLGHACAPGLRRTMGGSASSHRLLSSLRPLHPPLAGLVAGFDEAFRQRHGGNRAVRGAPATHSGRAPDRRRLFLSPEPHFRACFAIRWPRPIFSAHTAGAGFGRFPGHPPGVQHPGDSTARLRRRTGGSDSCLVAGGQLVALRQRSHAHAHPGRHYRARGRHGAHPPDGICCRSTR